MNRLSEREEVTMKLYSIHNSNNCRRVNATILHLGLDVEIAEQAMGDLKKPEYLALNPNGKVPTLVDGDFKLWESRAIMQYLASKKPGTPFWPSDAKRQADILRWQFWETSHLSKGTGAFAFEKLFKKIFMKQDPDPVALAAGEKEFHAFAPTLNGQLEGKKFITGSDLTLADFSVGACFSYAEASGLPWGNYPHIQSWWGRLNEIPAWKSTAPKLG
jgi:glutathione S-transferase